MFLRVALMSVNEMWLLNLKGLREAWMQKFGTNLFIHSDKGAPLWQRGIWIGDDGTEHFAGVVKELWDGVDCRGSPPICREQKPIYFILSDTALSLIRDIKPKEDASHHLEISSTLVRYWDE